MYSRRIYNIKTLNPINYFVFLKMVESKRSQLWMSSGCWQTNFQILSNTELLYRQTWRSKMLASEELALLDISRLVESRIQTIRFLKNGRKYRGHNFGGARGATNFQICPTPNYCSDELGDPRCWMLDVGQASFNIVCHHSRWLSWLESKNQN